jgi:TetR/AcrR family transcriptional regulator
MIWAMTQSYADFSAQMALVLGRKQLTRKDYDDGEETIVRMVMAAISLPAWPHHAQTE